MCLLLPVQPYLQLNQYSIAKITHLEVSKNLLGQPELGLATLKASDNPESPN
jgi:hypothetical protein